MTIIVLAINPYEHIEIQDNFFLLSRENWFGHGKVIFQHDNASF